jgi:hypothetical protein
VITRVFDGQLYYDRHLRPFVETHGERNGPVDTTRIWPPAREDAEYYRLADLRHDAEEKKAARKPPQLERISEKDAAGSRGHTNHPTAAEAAREESYV